MSDKTVYKGQLEIDRNAGVIYFHSDEGVTILRVTHLLTPMPRNTSVDMVSVPHLTSYPPLDYQPRPSAKPSARKADYRPQEDRCPVCLQVHKPEEMFRAKDGSQMVAGHEYEIETQMGTERYARGWRMGLLGGGLGGVLQFDARGPDRSTDQQYGGTQAILADSILTAREVGRDKSRRHTAERKPR